MTPGATKKLFADIAPRFSDRAGGYTRIIHAGFRIGDGANLAILELLGSKLKKKEKKEKAAKPEPAEQEKKEEKAGA
jgi:large subunit ribosomal protein L17